MPQNSCEISKGSNLLMSNIKGFTWAVLLLLVRLVRKKKEKKRTRLNTGKINKLNEFLKSHSIFQRLTNC